MDDIEILGRLFSSRVRTKLLNFFLTMPESSYFIRELERKIGEDAKNISRELNNLENIGFVRSEKRGLQKFYSIRKDFLFYSGLKDVFAKSSGIVGLFSETMGQVERVEKVFLKDIPASNEEEAQINLIVVGSPDRAILNDTVNGLIERTGRDIVYRCYSAKEFDERLRMDDAFVLDVSAGERIFG